MELTRDIYLRGAAWATAVQNLSDIFRTRTNYSLFMLSLSLGIMYDKRIKNPDMGEMEDHTPPSVPRNVLQNNDNGKLDFIEHKAVINAARHLEKYGFSVECVSPDATGRISAEDVLNRVREDTLLVSVMHVNNETGVIQPVHEIGQALAEKNVLFHVDATQSCGKLVKELQTLNYNMLSIGAHKLSGPQGIGALILKKRRYKLPPVQAITFGGAQEHGLRPGTLPTALIAGMGKACEIALAEYEQNNAHCAALKEIVLQELSNSGLKYEINGNPTYCVPNTINFSIDGISSEALMLASKQYCGISNGSACNSHDYSASYVLTSMKLNPDRIESAVRISWGPNIAPEVFAASIHELLSVAKEML